MIIIVFKLIHVVDEKINIEPITNGTKENLGTRGRIDEECNSLLWQGDRSALSLSHIHTRIDTPRHAFVRYI